MKRSLISIYEVLAVALCFVILQDNPVEAQARGQNYGLRRARPNQVPFEGYLRPNDRSNPISAELGGGPMIVKACDGGALFNTDVGGSSYYCNTVCGNLGCDSGFCNGMSCACRGCL